MQELSTIPRRPRRRGLYVVMAVVVVAAALALAVLVVPPATTSGAGADDARPNAGSAIVHEDADIVGDLYYPLPHGKASSCAGPAVPHDAADNANR